MSWIKRVIKKDGSVYLYEYKSIRQGKKVISEYVRYLGVESDQEKVPLPKKSVMTWKPPERSVRSGDVTAFWHIAQDLKIAQTIDRICGYNKRDITKSPGTLLTFWAINRALDPESTTQLPAWLECTDLPRLAGFTQNIPGKDAFYEALDCVCSYDKKSDTIIDNTKALDEMLYSVWRNQHPLPKDDSEVVAYDMTSVIVYGNTCPFVKKGHNAEEGKHQQINLSVLVSKYDQHPLAQRVHPGNHSSMTTMQELIPRLSDFAIKEGTIIWDRGNTSQKTVTALEKHDWKVICGVPKISSDAKKMVQNVDIPGTQENLVPCKNIGELYAVKIRAQLYGKEREAVVYRNVTKAAGCLVKRNRAIHEISGELNKLKKNIDVKTQELLRNKISKILEGRKSFFIITMPSDGKIVDFEWKLNTDRMEEALAMDGKYLVYSTDESYSAPEVVRLYLEKDFVEKFFQIVKVDEDMKPVRHRLENRVRAYFFVCTLAYRLLSALRWMIVSADSKNASIGLKDFLKKLRQIDRLEVDLGKEVESFYVNVTKDVRDQLNVLGMKSILVSDRRPNV
ncbi:MAG: IS1634 family transposase [Methanoregula sp.]|nr:IS1634 family transposase [Methanoregula sp.]